MDDPLIAVVSARRPENVPAMRRWLDETGLDVVWIVDDVDAYVAAGAADLPTVRVVDSAGIADARQTAVDLGRAEERWVIQTSDDLRSLVAVTPVSPPISTPLPLSRAVSLLVEAGEATGARHVGVPPHTNAAWAARSISGWGWLIGDLTATSPGCAVDYDPDLRLSEDVDYSCRVLDRYGLVARVGWLLAEYAHETNPGGVVSYRTAELQQEMNERLIARWPAYLAPHPDPTEFKFRPKPGRAAS